MDSIWPKRKKAKILPGEDFDREGHWVRDFKVRQESWSIIEHWASECGYRMVACKPRRRLYQRGNSKAYLTLVDIRHEEHRVVLTSWIQVGFKLRLATLWVLPKELPVEAAGFLGIRTRRAATRDLNLLLGRLRQHEILNSRSFNVFDLDLSTLLLSAVLIIPWCYYAFSSALRVEVRPGLSASLLGTLATKLMLLFVVAMTVILLHHWVMVKKMSKTWIKITSASVLGILFAALSMVFVTRTATEIREQKIAHHCILRFDSARCSQELAQMSPKDREILTKRMDAVQKELALRPR